MIPAPDTSVLDDDTKFEAQLVSKVVDAVSHLNVSVRVEKFEKPSRGKLSRSAGTGQVIHTPKSRAASHARAVKRQGDTFVVELKSAANRKKLRNAVAQAVKGATMRGYYFVDPAALRIVEVVERTLPQARRRASEATIEKMVDALVETHDPVAPINAEIDAANAKARVLFIEQFPTYTAEEVTANAESTAKNRHQTASRWKASGRVFSVPFHGKDRFPAFQFKDGRPLPVIAEALAALPNVMTPWEIAFWFVSANGWLDNAAPRDRLTEPERVVEAARLESETIVG